MNQFFLFSDRLTAPDTILKFIPNPMNPIIQLLEARKASRSFSSKPLPPEALTEMAEAARLTPSCFNNQPWRFLFLESEPALEKGRHALTGGNRAWALKAPLLIIGYSRPQDDCRLKDGREYHQFDLGMSCMNIMLAATHQGLNARPLAGFDPEIIRTVFGLAPEYQPLVMIAVGYESSDESHLPANYRGLAGKPRLRKSVDEFLKRL